MVLRLGEEGYAENTKNVFVIFFFLFIFKVS